MKTSHDFLDETAIAVYAQLVGAAESARVHLAAHPSTAGIPVRVVHDGFETVAYELAEKLTRCRAERADDLLLTARERAIVREALLTQSAEEKGALRGRLANAVVELFPYETDGRAAPDGLAQAARLLEKLVGRV